MKEEQFSQMMEVLDGIARDVGVLRESCDPDPDRGVRLLKEVVGLFEKATDDVLVEGDFRKFTKVCGELSDILRGGV